MSAALPVASAAPASGQHGRAVGINERARGAGRVVVGEVLRVDAVEQVNEHGDRLIGSQTWIRVREAMKGAPADTMMVEIEDGTLNGVTKRASAMSALEVGGRALFFVKRGRTGTLVPHLRGNGILKLDARGGVEGSDVSVDQIRAQVRSAG